MLAALSFAFFIARHFDFKWRGILAELVDLWGAVVRPLTKQVVDYAFVIPFEWAFHIRVEVPLIVRDYLSVGIILLLSVLRARVRLTGVDKGTGWIKILPLNRYGVFFYILSIFVIVFLWPFYAYELVATSFFQMGQARKNTEKLKMLRKMASEEQEE